MDNKFALNKQNLKWIAIGFAFVLLGFFLMMGKPSGETEYNPDIFSFKRIVLGPGISLFGFLLVLFGILKKSKRD